MAPTAQELLSQVAKTPEPQSKKDFSFMDSLKNIAVNGFFSGETPIINTLQEGLTSTAAAALDFHAEMGDFAEDIFTKFGYDVTETGKDFRVKERAFSDDLLHRAEEIQRDKPQVSGLGGNVIKAAGSFATGPLVVLADGQAAFEETFKRTGDKDLARKAGTADVIVGGALFGLSAIPILSPFGRGLTPVTSASKAAFNAVKEFLLKGGLSASTVTGLGVARQAIIESYDPATDVLDDESLDRILNTGLQTLKEQGPAAFILGGAVAATGRALNTEILPEIPKAKAKAGALVPAEQISIPGETPAKPQTPQAPVVVQPERAITTSGKELIPQSTELTVRLDDQIGPTRSIRPDPLGTEGINIKDRPQRPTNIPIESFEVSEETQMQAFRRIAQDRFNRMEVVTKKAREQGRSVPDDKDFFLKASLMAGNARQRIESFRRHTEEPLLKMLAKAEITPDEFGDFLYARHAPARNARLREITETEFDGLSGITDREARAMLTRVRASGKEDRFVEIEKILRHSVIDERLAVGIKENITSLELVNKLRASFPDNTYVPLFEQDLPQAGIRGLGRNRLRKEARRLQRGNAEKRQNPFVSALSEMERTLASSERNKVRLALLEFIEENPNEKLFVIRKGQPKPQRSPRGPQIEGPDAPTDPLLPFEDPRTGEISESDPTFITSSNIIEVRRAGKSIFIEIKDNALARAFQNLNDKHIIAPVRIYANFFRAVNTVFSPEFVINNFIGDFQTAVLNATGIDDPGASRAIMANTKEAMKAVWQVGRAEQGKRVQPTGKWADVVRELNEVGGQTGFFMMDMDVDEKLARLSKAIKRHNTSPALKNNFENVWERFSDVVFMINETVEMGVRTAFFEHIKSKGMSPARSGLEAKNLTVNFDRKGEIGAMMNSIFVFSNAPIQGNVQMLKALSKSRTLQSVVAVATLGGFINAFLNDMINEKDYDTLSRNSPDLMQRYMIWMTPDGGMIKHRLPYGYNIFPYVGNLAYQVGKGRLDIGEALKRLILGFDAAFNPLSSSSFSQLITPTILDPFNDVSTNLNWMGRDIVPEQNPFRPEKKESSLYFKSLAPASKEVTDYINRVTGGTELEAGGLDVSPELIDHFAAAYGGAVGRQLLGILRTGDAVLRGDLPEVRDVPILRSFYSPPNIRRRLTTVYDIRRNSRKEFLSGDTTTVFFNNIIDLVKEGELDHERAGNLIDDVVKGQSAIMATRQFGGFDEKSRVWIRLNAKFRSRFLHDPLVRRAIRARGKRRK